MLHAYRHPDPSLRPRRPRHADRRRHRRSTNRDRSGHCGRGRVHRPRHAGTTQVLEVMTMPRSIQEILDHADHLAKRFEDYEPGPDDERPVEEYLLQRAALARARSERQVVEAARGAGLSWARIGTPLSTSAQAAQQRYGAVAEQA